MQVFVKRRYLIFMERVTGFSRLEKRVRIVRIRGHFSFSVSMTDCIFVTVCRYYKVRCACYIKWKDRDKND